MSKGITRKKVNSKSSKSTGGGGGSQGLASVLSVSQNGGTHDITNVENVTINKTLLIPEVGNPNTLDSTKRQFCIGGNNTLAGQDNIAIGAGHNLSVNNCGAFGTGSTISSSASYSFGEGNTIQGEASVAIGYGNTIDSTSNDSFCGGTASGLFGSPNGFAFGNGAQCAAAFGIAMGNNSQANAVSGIALGNGNLANGENSAVIGGSGNVATADNSAIICCSGVTTTEMDTIYFPNVNSNGLRIDSELFNSQDISLGGTFTIPNSAYLRQNYQLFNTFLGSVNINFPASPINNQIIKIVNTGTISVINISGNGNTIDYTPTPLLPTGFSISYMYASSTTTWNYIGN